MGILRLILAGYHDPIYAVISIAAAGLLVKFFMLPIERFRKWLFSREKKQARQSELESAVEPVSSVAGAVKESL